ncbi:hypothetical protein F4811DRAFT_533949 [Daldinia bambusicola]|nr:hypothetical protein F4811DRAFT_533949 [Daldinia bambusicola]
MATSNQNSLISSGDPSDQTAPNNNVLHSEKTNERTLNLHPSTIKPLIPANLSGELTEVDESSVPSHSYQPSYLDTTDCQSTSPTQISEALDHADNEVVNADKPIGGNDRTRDILLHDLRIPNGSLSQRDALPQPDATPEVGNDVINLEGVNPEPSQKLSHTMNQIDSVLKDIPSPTREAGSFPYPCGTEATSISSIRLNVGEGPNIIFRWKPGFEITYNTDRFSFGFSIDYLNMANEKLDAAAQEWNRGQIGVRFKRVGDHEKAVFRLVYSASGSNYLATAFFPNAAPSSRQLILYNVAFKEVNGCYDSMTGLFCHELGHILGVRHELAHEKERRHPSIQFGKENLCSIMNDDLPLNKMRIQDEDYALVKQFYRAGPNYGGYVIKDVEAKPYFCRCSHCCHM